MEFITNEIQKLAQKSNITKVILFGSRARLDNNDRSDIDLAVYTDDIQAYNDFLCELENIETLLKFDVTLIAEDMNEEFLNSIAKEGIIIYEKL